MLLVCHICVSVTFSGNYILRRKRGYTLGDAQDICGSISLRKGKMLDLSL